MNLIVLCLFPARPTQDSFQPGLQSQASTLHGGGQPCDAPSQPVDPSPSPQAPFPCEPSWPCEGASVPLQVHPVCALHPWGPCPRFVVGPMAGGAGRRRAGGAERGAETSPLPPSPPPPQSCGSPRSVPFLPEAPRPPSQQQHGHVAWPLAFVAPQQHGGSRGQVVLCFLPRGPSPLQWDRQKQAPPARGGEGWSGGSRRVSCGDGRTL